MSWRPHPLQSQFRSTCICFVFTILLVGDLYSIDLKHPRPTPTSLLGSVAVVNYSRSVQKSFPCQEHYSSNLLSFVVLSLVVTQLLSALALFYLFSQCFVQCLIDCGELPEDFQPRIVRRFFIPGTSEIDSHLNVEAEQRTQDKTPKEHQ